MMHSIQKEVVDRLQVTSWDDVSRHLRSLTGRQKGPAGDGIDKAVAFYQLVLDGEFAGQLPRALLELLGIDYSLPVERTTLGARRTFQTYCMCDVVLGETRPHEGRVLRDGADRMLAPRIGCFLTDIGVAADRLGIFLGNRRCVRLRAMQQVTALQSTASGLVDVWTDRPSWSTGPGVPHLAGGRGIQYRITKAAAADRDVLVVV